MCLSFLAIGFSIICWWAVAIRGNSTSYVRVWSFVACSELAIIFWHNCITCKSRRCHTRSVTGSFPVKTSKFSCFYAARTSRKINAIARNKALKLRVTPPASCRLTYLLFRAESTCGVKTDCLQLRVFLCANCNPFCLKRHAILHASRGWICMTFACKITCKISAMYSAWDPSA